MKNKLCEQFGIDFPLFAFSHCRDVVAEVTNAGGVGVLGAVGHTPESLEIELSWIDEKVKGRPYGIDLLIPNKLEAKEGGLTAAEFSEARVRAMVAEAVGDGAALSYGTARTAFEAALPEAEVMLLNGRQDLSDLPRRAPHLRWLGLTSAGVEYFMS